MFHAADPEGFFVGELNGEPIACLSCVRYGTDYGFFGQYIVRPAHRGLRYGLVIGKVGLAHLAGRNVGLDGVMNKVSSYERVGFRFAHHTIRYAGTGGGTRPDGLVELRDSPFAAVAEYDAVCFPAPREAFLRALVSLPESVGLAAMNGERFVGFGVMRKSSNGYKVGPLFADDTDTAGQILAGLVAAAPGVPFCIDIPDETVQPSGTELVHRFGLAEVFRTARMYTGGVPAFDAANVFGTTSLELG
jgi:hypothetical protein